MTPLPRVLTIAGSDSGGGAGIQTDLRTFAALGCHGMSAVTALTAQNSLGVQGVFPTSAEGVAAQLESVLSDIGADAAKTGMLFSAGIVEAVAGVLDRRPLGLLVVDPVMVAKGGAPLLRDDAQQALKARILPKALLVTPNLPEAEVLSGVAVENQADAREACARILALGPRAVLLKGGHGTGATVEDVYVEQGGRTEVFCAPRLDTRHTHGTGCTLSATVAAYLGLGCELHGAVAKAHAFLQVAIREGYPLGAGHGPTNPVAASRLVGAYPLLERLWEGWEILEQANPVHLVPEVQSNLAEALPGARSPSDVAAFPGRLARCAGRLRRLDGPRFGASRHLAGVLIAAAATGSPWRAVVNVRLDPDVLDACRALGLAVEGVRPDEEHSGGEAPGDPCAHAVLSRCGSAPDVLCRDGGPGREPMALIFGRDAPDAARRVAAVSGRVCRREG